MTSMKQRALRAFREMMGRKADRQTVWRGVLGNGQGTVRLSDRKDRVYVQLRASGETVAAALSLRIADVPGTPVLLRRTETGRDWEVYDVDYEMLTNTNGGAGWDSLPYGIPGHARTHEWPDGAPGTDPVNVYPRSLSMLRTYRKNATSLTVKVSPLRYPYAGKLKQYTGGELRLYTYQPPAGYARYVATYLDPSVNATYALPGPVTVDATTVIPVAPTLPPDVFPSALVKLTGSKTYVSESDITDYRLILSTTQSTSGVSTYPFTTLPEIAFDSSAAPGSSVLTIRSDATIKAFDTVVPVTQAIGDSAAVGSAAYAARRDHRHGMPEFATAGIADIAAVGSAGASYLIPRADHVHAHPVLDSGDLHPEYMTPDEHTAVGDGAPHHAAVTLAADADTLLGLSTQQLTLDSQDANTVLAGPSSGAAADPTFRALVAADIGLDVAKVSKVYASDGDPVALSADADGALTAVGNIAAPSLQGTSWGYLANHRWGLQYVTVNDSTYAELTHVDGSALNSDYMYRVRMVTRGTSNNTGACYLVHYDNDTSAWVIRLVSYVGTSSNNPQLFLDSGVVKIKTGSSTSYPVRVLTEAFYLAETDARLTLMGADYGWQRIGDNLNYTDGNVVASNFEVPSGGGWFRDTGTTVGICLQSDGNVRARLGDAAGAKSFVIQDSSGTTVGYLNSDGAMTLDGGITLGGALTAGGNINLGETFSLSGGTATIADNSVYSFTPNQNIGVILLHSRHVTLRASYALLCYRCIGTVYAQLMVTGTNVEATTGALTGTTGTDGKLTISAHTDGKIYIENRLGGNYYAGWVLLGQ